MFGSHQIDAGKQRHTRVTRDVERVSTANNNYKPLRSLIKPYCIIVLFGGLDNLNDHVIKITNKY